MAVLRGPEHRYELSNAAYDQLVPIENTRASWPFVAHASTLVS